MVDVLIMPWSSDYEEYLRDESRGTGEAETISFPTTEPEVIEILQQASARGGSVTIQGARTGIVAGAVPRGGHVLNLSRMKGVGEVRVEEQRLTVEPGVLLTEVREAVEPYGLMFPPDPTESSASIGGMVACNASGALSFHYGPTRRWVEALRVVLADGSVLNLRRGENFAKGRSFELRTEDGHSIQGTLPSYVMPNVKSAAGYYAADDMDMVDLFVGMEGTLGVVTQVELRLIPKPGAISGLTVFFASEEPALSFVRAVRGEEVEGLEPVTARPVAIEFFNSDALNLLRRMKSESPAFAEIPALQPQFHTAVYVEFHGESEEELEEAVMQVMEVMGALGVSDDDTWYATSERELEPIKAFRHAIPEAVNLLIGERKRDCPDLTKLGTDMSVPDSALEEVLSLYNSGLLEAGLESVIFGHIGNNHVHVNILPHDMQEYERGKQLYMEWARRIVEFGGSVSAEHGIGKIKAPFLRMMYGEEYMAQMLALKKLFDPAMMLNPGNLFG